MSSAFMRTWIYKPEAYPLFVTLGAGCALCVFQCSRCFSKSPDVRVYKADRAAGVLEEDRYFKEGEKFYNHAVRRYFSTCTKQIWPGLNETFGGK
mmetsp:Transcript_34768/g.41962  ORF Transcript_34768/g.41962 Transcript_34768/m.41962 type:complete len:95 (-) Transcript_34768:336-620(-)|eukprot:CAMPEP_0197866236 /NCGR_PEP_ID=MMETSP1438-20131217/44107_1 /TAXON_ID=1461541 /ORGANISM="Pterosperma sp., Strain CCMP1384" /LENGTH=94 /DNA_ID=CAMNT_0043484789 /DNA_START=871 /DNA_END=1155 /DNA_ORIENTATION=+